MADIKNFLKERSKRENTINNTNKYSEAFTKDKDYLTKIRQHKLRNFYKIILTIAIIMIVSLIIYSQYKKHVYTTYEVVNSISSTTSGTTTNIALDDAILTYSKDGAHCTNSKGEVVWNQTFEIQDMCISTCKNTVIMGNYNGRICYVANSKEILTQIETTLPIKAMSVSENGRSTIIMTDSDTTWINTYDEEGNQIYSGQTHMQNSGYPFSISLSPNGELLAVAYVYVDSGTIKSNVAFYNFGPVGANESDYIVSAYTYTDIMIPYVKFVDNSTCYAVADSRIMVFKGSQKPESAMEYLYNDEIRSVYSNGEYLGVVLASDKSDYSYKMDVYNSTPSLKGTYYFNLDYTDIFFEDEDFVAYNENECLIKTYSGKNKFEGNFDKAINMMKASNGAYRYVIASEDAYDTIQLK